MKKVSDTPYTDAVIEVDCGGDDYSALIEFARGQERKIRLLRDQLQDARDTLYAIANDNNDGILMRAVDRCDEALEET